MDADNLRQALSQLENEYAELLSNEAHPHDLQMLWKLIQDLRRLLTLEN